MLDVWLVVAAGLGVGVAAVSRRLDELPLSEPLLGLLAGMLLGPRLLDVLALPTGGELEILHLASRLTLAVALMAVALRYPFATMRVRARELAWLLLLVLPLMALASAATAWASLGLGVGLALTLGAALAPTDPVLASSVVTGDPAARTLPDRLREILSLESGANDGLAMVLVLLAAGLVTDLSFAGSLARGLWAVGGAILLGWSLGRLAAVVLALAERRGAIDTSHELMFSLVLAIAALGLASLLAVDDLLGVFVTGLAFNAHTQDRERETEETIDEGVNRVLVLPLFVLFGVAVPWSAWGELGGPGVAFALGVLLLRRLPVVLLLGRLVGARRLADAVWLGWYGPIGVAAVYYLTHLDALGVSAPEVWAAGSLTVTASIVAHGVSASPGRRWYGRVTAAGGPGERGR
jgi:sodium/hydrogen antiporter